jgi:predicted  nucleic acid-binding Zn-ribbon protein
MRATLQRLYEAQHALRLAPPGSPQWRSITRELADSVPAPVLAHFLRRVANGGRGVALVRHGVCSECHIRVPFSLVSTLASPEGSHVCDYCGSLLLLPDEELGVPAPGGAHPAGGARKCRRVLVA